MPLMCSGHGAMQENYYLDDGAYSAVRCVIELVRTAKEGGGRDITALLADLKEATESREYRLKVPARHTGSTLSQTASARAPAVALACRQMSAGW